MAIDKKLIHFKTWNKFIEQIGGEANVTTPTSGKEEDGTALYGQIKGTSIVFIKDVGKIWTHGNLYGENEIVIDDVLSDTSENPVKGNVIKEYVDLHPQYESVDEIDVPELDLPMVECDSELSTTSIKPVYNRVITQALDNKVDKVSGKQLSTEDFTTSLKNKLVGLKEFDPTEINNEIDALAQQVNTKQNKLVSGTSIKTINGESILGNGDIQVVAEITVDSSVSDTSTNPIQNKAIKDYVDSNTYEQRIIYSVANGTLTTSQRTHNAETYTKLINREKIAVYYSDFNNTPLIPLSVGSMNMMTNVITLVHYSGVAPSIATTTFELHSDGNVESTSILYNAPSIDAALSSTSTNSIQNKVITAALDNKIDKVTGKGLSTEDFTTALKTKLEGLTNYDDAAIQNAVNGLTTQLNTLVNGDASVAIESFNEIIAFLNGVEDSESLDSIIASIEQQIAGKQDKLVSGTNIKTLNGESILGEGNIVVNVDTSNLATKEELNAKQNTISDLDTIRSGAAKGATAIQQVKTINGEEIVGEGNIEINVDTSTLATKEELVEAEEVTAAALNDINERIGAIEENVSGSTVTKDEFESAITTITESVETKADKTYVDEELAKKADKIYVEDAIGNIDFTTLATKEELQNLTNEIIENEEVNASAFNDLEDRKADKIYVDEELAGAEKVTAISLCELNKRIEVLVKESNTKDELQDAVNDIIEIITENEEVWAATIADLENTKEEKGAFVEELAEVEEVWAASFNQVNSQIEEMKRYINDEAASRRQFEDTITRIDQMFSEHEEVITAAWNQLNTRINALEATQRG